MIVDSTCMFLVYVLITIIEDDTFYMLIVHNDGVIYNISHSPFTLLVTVRRAKMTSRKKRINLKQETASEEASQTLA